MTCGRIADMSDHAALSTKRIAILVEEDFEDRELPLTERLSLRLHMTICTACPKFAHQFLIMRNAMKPWKNYEADPGAGDAAGR